MGTRSRRFSSPHGKKLVLTFNSGPLGTTMRATAASPGSPFGSTSSCLYPRVTPTRRSTRYTRHRPAAARSRQVKRKPIHRPCPSETRYGGWVSLDEYAIAARVSSLLGQADIARMDAIQELWSGYGAIYRVHFHNRSIAPVIVKAVSPPDRLNHPRGWNSGRSHRRKVASYHLPYPVFKLFIAMTPQCRVPALLAEVCTDRAGCLS